MARNYAAQAKLARERLNKNEDSFMANVRTTPADVTAPPKAKQAPLLRDAFGNLYLFTEQLADRGDLVAGYDPENPDAYATDQHSIQRNRELQLARERADIAEAARLEAEKLREEAETKRLEDEKIAIANSQRAEKAEAELEAQKAEHAKQIAEMQAQLDALAKQATSSVVQSAGGAKENSTSSRKKTAPKKKAATVEADDLAALDD